MRRPDTLSPQPQPQSTTRSRSPSRSPSSSSFTHLLSKPSKWFARSASAPKFPHITTNSSSSSNSNSNEPRSSSSSTRKHKISRPTDPRPILEGYKRAGGSRSVMDLSTSLDMHHFPPRTSTSTIPSSPSSLSTPRPSLGDLRSISHRGWSRSVDDLSKSKSKSKSFSSPISSPLSLSNTSGGEAISSSPTFEQKIALYRNRGDVQHPMHDQHPFPSLPSPSSSPPALADVHTRAHSFTPSRLREAESRREKGFGRSRSVDVFSSSDGGGGVFAVDLDCLLKREANGDPIPRGRIPHIIHVCLSEIEARGLSEVGIYRIAGALSETTALKHAFNTGIPHPLTRTTDIHAICDLVKTWLRVLPHPVFTPGTYRAVMAVMREAEGERELERVRKIVWSLPTPNFDLLKRVAMHLERCVHESTNQMTPSALAIVFSPTLLRAPNNDFALMMANMGSAHRLVRMLIVHFHGIFDDEEEEDDEDEEEEGVIDSSPIIDSRIIEEEEEDIYSPILDSPTSDKEEEGSRADV